MLSPVRHTRSYRFFELLIISFLWILLFSSPFLLRPTDSPVIWNNVYRLWKEQYVPLLLLFFINRFLLLRLFFQKKRSFYFISIISLIALLTAGSYFYSIYGRQQQRLAIRELPFRSTFPTLSGHRDLLPVPPRPFQPRTLPPFVNLMILSVLVVGFDTGLKISVRWAKEEQERERLKKENMENQLVYLRNQISPHFFMNTLNNVHALVVIDPEKAREAIIMLSGMMRHLLYDTRVENISLAKEIDFIRNYISLMKLRLSRKVRVELHLPAIIPDKQVPPLLFISLIENAFKHGVSYGKKSFIEVCFWIEGQYLTLKVRNSRNRERQPVEKSGIGIENTRKRLDLIYRDKYIFDIEDREDLFVVTLTIPL